MVKKISNTQQKYKNKKYSYEEPGYVDDFPDAPECFPDKQKKGKITCISASTLILKV